MDKHVVVISRQWSGPLIRVDVTNTEVAISMSLPEFIEALAAQAGNPATLLTVNALRARLRAAADAVVLGMKQESARVM